MKMHELFLWSFLFLLYSAVGPVSRGGLSTDKRLCAPERGMARRRQAVVPSRSGLVDNPPWVTAKPSPMTIDSAATIPNRDSDGSIAPDELGIIERALQRVLERKGF